MGKSKLTKQAEAVIEGDQPATVGTVEQQAKTAPRELNIFEKLIVQGMKMRKLQKEHKKRGGQHRFNDKKLAEEKFDLLLGLVLQDAENQAKEAAEKEKVDHE